MYIHGCLLVCSVVVCLFVVIVVVVDFLRAPGEFGLASKTTYILIPYCSAFFSCIAGLFKVEQFFVNFVRVSAFHERC